MSHWAWALYVTHGTNLAEEGPEPRRLDPEGRACRISDSPVDLRRAGGFSLSWRRRWNMIDKSPGGLRSGTEKGDGMQNSTIPGTASELILETYGGEPLAGSGFENEPNDPDFADEEEEPWPQR
jgi:hypothetical protein